MSSSCFEDSEEFSGDVALEAAADVAVGLAVGASAVGVGLGLFVASQTGDGDGVDCRVESAVTEAVEAMSGREARRRGDWRGPGEHREGGLVADASGLAP